MILFCKVYSRSMELNYFWVGLQTKNDQFWKFIDTNEKYFHNFTIMQYGFPFLMNIILDYLGLGVRNPSVGFWKTMWVSGTIRCDSLCFRKPNLGFRKTDLGSTEIKNDYFFFSFLFCFFCFLDGSGNSMTGFRCRNDTLRPGK